MKALTNNIEITLVLGGFYMAVPHWYCVVTAMAANIEWPEKYLKQDFSKLLWADECRSTFDGPDGWA